MNRFEIIQSGLEQRRLSIERDISAKLRDHDKMVREVMEFSEVLDHLEDSGWEVKMLDVSLSCRLSIDGFPILDLLMALRYATPCATRTRPTMDPKRISCSQDLGKMLDALRLILPERLIIEDIPDRIWRSLTVIKGHGSKMLGPPKSPIIVNYQGLMRRESESGWVSAAEMVAKLERRAEDLIARHGGASADQRSVSRS